MATNRTLPPYNGKTGTGGNLPGAGDFNFGFTGVRAKGAEDKGDKDLKKENTTLKKENKELQEKVADLTAKLEATSTPPAGAAQTE